MFYLDIRNIFRTCLAAYLLVILALGAGGCRRRPKPNYTPAVNLLAGTYSIDARKLPERFMRIPIRETYNQSFEKAVGTQLMPMHQADFNLIFEEYEQKRRFAWRAMLLNPHYQIAWVSKDGQLIARFKGEATSNRRLRGKAVIEDLAKRILEPSFAVLQQELRKREPATEPENPQNVDPNVPRPEMPEVGVEEDAG